MITADQIIEIGRFNQPHGIKGEINAFVQDGTELEHLSCIVLDIDGINVPFFISGLRQRGPQSYLVTIDGIENEQKATILVNKTIYALSEEVADNDENADGEEGYYAEDFIGFTITSTDGILNGIISDIDDATDNVLFIVKTDNKTHLIPVADEMIVDIDDENHRLTVELPIGLLDL